MRSQEAYVNLVLTRGYEKKWWGRAIFRVDDVDALYAKIKAAERLAELSEAWLTAGLSKEKGFDKLKAWCQTGLREDLKNVTITFWAGDQEVDNILGSMLED